MNDSRFSKLHLSLIDKARMHSIEHGTPMNVVLYFVSDILDTFERETAERRSVERDDE